MVLKEEVLTRMLTMQVLIATHDLSCLKKFLSLQGLKLLWSWMIDSADLSSSEAMRFRIHVRVCLMVM